ncbi:hypothetical protein LLEC1_07068 [Akanthomyces lecanii]|uniref:AB hydrolase-1 domain-containing protein n=1 Tax=Cordyceps confragosa TaxID=2714763 RepID=A0A179I9H3_CORDF|nr:hypothetical protein LLEC1_07068 [Akanthomyces lecanii]
MVEATLFPGVFREFSLTTQNEPEVIIRGVTSGDASSSSLPPLLLIHGFPQTHHMWHRIAPALAARFTIVAPDIRGYGQSSKPAGVASYAKSAMARDMVSVMDQLGWGPRTPFYIIGHDRGARVAHKLLAPPFPESLMAAQPGMFLNKWLGARSEGSLEGRFDSRCLDVYAAGLADPETARAMCDDYRAAYEYDTAEQRADREAGLLITRPLQVLWAAEGAVGTTMDCVKDWQDVADPSIKVTGHAVDCSHFIPDECPSEVIDAALKMFVET